MSDGNTSDVKADRPSPQPARRRSGVRPRALIERDLPIIRREIEAAEVDGETVLMNTGSGVLYGFDGAGERIWDLLASPCRFSELVDALVAEFEVDHDICTEQSRGFLLALMREGLVVAADEQAESSAPV